MARAASAAAAALVRHLLPAIRGAAPAPFMPFASASSEKIMAFHTSAATAAAASSTPARAYSALTQSRCFSTRATKLMMRRLEQRIKKQEMNAGRMDGWRIAHLKANHKLDLLISNGDEHKMMAYMHRDMFVIFAGSLTVITVVADALNFKDALAELFAPQPVDGEVDLKKKASVPAKAEPKEG